VNGGELPKEGSSGLRWSDQQIRRERGKGGKKGRGHLVQFQEVKEGGMIDLAVGSQAFKKGSGSFLAIRKSRNCLIKSKKKKK